MPSSRRSSASRPACRAVARRRLNIARHRPEHARCRPVRGLPHAGQHGTPGAARSARAASDETLGRGLDKHMGSGCQAAAWARRSCLPTASSSDTRPGASCSRLAVSAHSAAWRAWRLPWRSRTGSARCHQRVPALTNLSGGHRGHGSLPFSLAGTPRENSSSQRSLGRWQKGGYLSCQPPPWTPPRSRWSSGAPSPRPRRRGHRGRMGRPRLSRARSCERGPHRARGLGGPLPGLCCPHVGRRAADPGGPGPGPAALSRMRRGARLPLLARAAPGAASVPGTRGNGYIPGRVAEALANPPKKRRSEMGFVTPRTRPTPRRGGRPRIYAAPAAPQRAYRARRRGQAA